MTSRRQSQKRRRPRTAHSLSPSPHKGFYVPGFHSLDGQKHTRMTFTELMDSSNGIKNMILAHEIAVNKNFRLEDLIYEEEPSSLHYQVSSAVHETFWRLMSEQLEEEPPNFTLAFSVLKDIREIILSLLIFPQHDKLKESILAEFDLELMEQQAKNSVLDMESYSHYVLKLMGRLCAPVRDVEIGALKQKTKDIVSLFRGIIKTLDNMKLDMANVTLQMARPFIMSKSVDYEKEKFKEFITETEDGLLLTRQWLQRHKPSENESTQKSRKDTIEFILTEAFLDILEWDDYYLTPETLVMDQKRMIVLRDWTEKASVTSSILLLTFSHLSSNSVVIPAESQKLKEKMKGNIDVLLQDFFSDEDLLVILPNVFEQVFKDVNDYLKDKDKSPLNRNDEEIQNLYSSIISLEDPNQKIRDLVQRRILEFSKSAIVHNSRLQIPPGLSICQKELMQIAGGFHQLVTYNRAVFGEIYIDLIENHVLFNDSKN